MDLHCIGCGAITAIPPTCTTCYHTSKEHRTSFGVVTIGPDWVSVSAEQHALYDWAHRPGACWPCSMLADMQTIDVSFDTDGLVDLVPSDVDLSGDELSAWTSDAIGAVLPEDHPCWDVTVGQFRG
jgi:hypothetical protein